MKILKYLLYILTFAINLFAKEPSFINPVTDVCWECLFPITISGVNVTPDNKDFNKNKSVYCFCSGTPPKAGIPITFWEPAKLVEVTKHKAPWNRKFIVTETYAHHDNSPNCDIYSFESKVVETERYEEKPDEWEVENKELLQLSRNPNCTFVTSKCIDPASEKIINGKKFKRACWKEELHFKYFHPERKGCSVLSNAKALLTSKKCIKTTPYGCELWELTFKLNNTDDPSNQLPDLSLYTFEDKDKPSKKNHSLAKVISKLLILKEVKNDLELSEESATKASVFKGQCLSCSRSILDNVLYDCCGSMSGGAVKVHLSDCTAEERSLAERNAKGLCHYIGYYKEQFLDVLWKSRDMHVYCCFPSKLARILQEEGRKQLNKGWGTPKEPQCGGLSVSKITNLDFEKLDLREVEYDFREKGLVNIKERLENFQKNLKSKIDSKGGENLGKIGSDNQHY